MVVQPSGVLSGNRGLNTSDSRKCTKFLDVLHSRSLRREGKYSEQSATSLVYTCYTLRHVSM